QPLSNVRGSDAHSEPGPEGTPLESGCCSYSPRISRYRAMASMPRKKFGRWNFSLGACRLSSGSPNPIITLGTPRYRSNTPTIGIDPPHRMYTVSLPKTCFMASAAAWMYLLSGSVRDGAPALSSFTSAVTPLGHTALTAA